MNDNYLRTLTDPPEEVGAEFFTPGASELQTALEGVGYCAILICLGMLAYLVLFCGYVV